VIAAVQPTDSTTQPDEGEPIGNWEGLSRAQTLFWTASSSKERRNFRIAWIGLLISLLCLCLMSVGALVILASVLLQMLH
jgi:hypothetical protein